VSIIEDEIFSLHLTGHIGVTVAKGIVVRSRELLAGRRLRVGFSDATGVTGMDAGIQGPAREFVAVTWSHGLREVYCASTAPGVRMLCVALGLATGVRFHIDTTVKESWARALAALKPR
jgi:hypothetical protein